MLTHPHLTVRIDRSTESCCRTITILPDTFFEWFWGKTSRVCTTDNLLVLMRCIHMSWGEACSAVLPNSYAAEALSWRGISQPTAQNSSAEQSTSKCTKMTWFVLQTWYHIWMRRFKHEFFSKHRIPKTHMEPKDCHFQYEYHVPGIVVQVSLQEGKAPCHCQNMFVWSPYHILYIYIRALCIYIYINKST